MPTYLCERLALRSINNLLSSSDPTWSDFDPDQAVTFRLDLPPEPSLQISSISEPEWQDQPDDESATPPEEAPDPIDAQIPLSLSYRRHALLELLGFGLRAYWVDQSPTALHGKPTALVLFRGPFRILAKRVDQPLTIAGQTTPSIGHDPAFQRPLTNLAAYQRISRQAGLGNIAYQLDTEMPPPPAPPIPLTPLGYPLPPTELGGGTTATGEPGTTPGSGPRPIDANGNACTPLYLAYGLLFQGRADGPPNDPHPLSRELQLVLRQFAFRGYGPAPGGAVPPIISASSPRTRNLTAMIASLQRLLTRHTAFCNAHPTNSSSPSPHTATDPAPTPPTTSPFPP